MDGRMYLRGCSAGDGLSPEGKPHRMARLTPLGRVPPAECHEAILDDVALCLGERAATGKAVHRVKHGVNHDGAVLGSRKQWRTFGDERQHRQAQVAVKRQRHLGGAEGGLGRRVETSGPLQAPGVALATTLGQL